MSNPVNITKSVVEAHISASLRNYIGPQGKVSYANAASLLDVDQRTLESWVRGESAPSAHNLLRLFILLGPVFANHVLEISGLGKVERIEPEKLSDLALNAKVTESIAALGIALEDGHIDHIERAELIPLLKLLSTKIDQWCSTS